MADGIEQFDWMRNMNRVGEGFKGGPLFMDPCPVPAMDIGGDWPAEVQEKLQAKPIPEPTPTDPWVARYPNAKL